MPRSGVLGAAVIMGITMLYASSALAEARCPDPPEPRVDVTIDFPRPDIVRSKTPAEIARIRNQRLDRTDEIMPVGLAVGSLDGAQQVRMRRWTDWGRTVCAAPKRVSIQLRVNDPTIYIASPFDRDTCSYQEILEHERRHLQVTRDVLEEHRDRIQAGIKRAARRLGSVGEPAPQDRIVDRLRDELTQLFNPMMREHRQRQSAIDSESEYRRLARVCDGTIARKMKRRDY